MDIIFEKSPNCCGCGACVALCRSKAITMKKNIKGFLYPSLDIGKCCKCGNCMRGCPVNERYIAKIGTTVAEKG